MSPSHFWYQCVGVAFVSSNSYDTVIICAWAHSVAEVWEMVLQNMHMLRSFVHSLLREKWGSGGFSTRCFNYHSIPYTQHSSASQTQNGSSKHPWPSSVWWIWFHIHQASPWQVQLQYLHKGAPWPSPHCLLWTALLWVLPQALAQEAEDNMPTLPWRKLQSLSQQSTQTWDRWPWNSMH